MISTGRIIDINLSITGGLRLTLEINEKAKALAELESIRNCDKLSIEIEKFSEKRTLQANKYFWQLIDKMAKVLKTDRNTLYLIQLSKYGVFSDLEVKRCALPIIKEHFRYVEEFDDGYEDSLTVRCYYGSSGYNKKEMSDLINGTVADAKEIGVETLTPDEIERMLNAWKGAGYV